MAQVAGSRPGSYPAIQPPTAVLGALATIVTTVGGILSGLGTVIATPLSPIGLVITAVLGQGAYLLYSSGASREALAWLGEGFGSLVNNAKTAVGAIGKALAAGGDHRHVRSNVRIGTSVHVGVVRFRRVSPPSSEAGGLTQEGGGAEGEVGGGLSPNTPTTLA